jgi:hypothetical protein
VGKVDLILDFGRGNPQIPCELKDFHSNLTDRIFDFNDVLQGKWTQKAARQLLCYLYGSGEPLGILVFTRPGLPKLVPVWFEDHFDLVEEFLNKAQNALDHKEAGTLPGYIEDLSECKRCNFYGLACQPPIASGEGTKIITDPETIEAIRRREELEPMADEYKAIDSDLKEKLRGIETALAGDYMIQGAWQPNTTYPVPKEIKQQYKKVDPRGKFLIKFINLSSRPDIQE